MVTTIPFYEFGFFLVLNYMLIDFHDYIFPYQGEFHYL